MQHLDLCRKSSGRLWHRKLIADPENGCLLNITNSLPNVVFKQGKVVRFLQIAFDRSGDRFVASDHVGNVYSFDLHKNRFSLVQKIGTPCTAIAFNLHQNNEVLVAVADYSLRCYNVESKELVSNMHGHSSSVHRISVHGSGRYAISTSQDTSILWDLDTFTRKRTLNGAETVGVQEVFFLPKSNTLISCFKDDSVFAWDSDTLKCLYQLHSPKGDRPMYKCFAATKDGRMIAAAGRSQFIHLWNMDTQHLIRIIQLPSKIKEAKGVGFVNDTLSADNPQTLAVLAQDGVLRFIDINECRLMYEAGSRNQRVLKFALSPNGRYSLCLMDDGSLNLFSIESLSGSAKKLPAPVVQEIEDNRGRRKRVASKQAQVGSLEESSDKGINGETLQWQQEKTDSLYKEFPDGLDMKRLLKILRGYGEYPEKYRLFIWRSLLRLPENHVAFSVLIEKGTHNAFARLHENYPIKSPRLLRSLERVMSALAYWSPIFGEAEFLPMVAFPFVKLFPNNHLICFEFVATVLLNWCQKWFEFFPNPPLTILGVIETILSHYDRHLMEHFVQVNVTTQDYAWPLMQTLFSEVLTKEDWLKLWDNIVSNHPSFPIFFIIAYLIANRQTLLSTTDIDDFKFFFHHRNAVDISAVIKEAYRLNDSTPEDIHPKRMIADYTPLTKGQYPIFDKYPKFVVDYLIQERERIRHDEVEYLRQKQMTLDLQKEAEKTRQEEEAFYRQQELMMEAENQRRSMIVGEEKKLADQRTRLQAMKREIALRELKLLDAVRRKFLNHQEKVQTVEIQRLDDELERKVLMREQETRQALDDAEIKSLELEGQKRLFQQELLRDNAEISMRHKSDLAINQKRSEMENMQSRHMVDATYGINARKLKDLHSQLARTQQVSGDINLLDAAEKSRKMEEFDREIKALEVAKASVENQMREVELHDLMNVLISKERDRNTKDRTDLSKAKKDAEDRSKKLPPVDEYNDMDLARRKAFDEKQSELLSQINNLRRKLANKDHRAPHSSSSLF